MNELNKDFSLIGKINEYTGKYKKYFILSWIFSAISGIFMMMPYVFIYFIMSELIDFFKSGGELNSSLLLNYGWSIVGITVLSFILYFTALMLSHTTAFNVRKNMILSSIEKIQSFNMAFHLNNTSGKLRKIIEKNTADTETFIAHLLPDLSQSFVIPIAILILILSFDYRLGIACLIPILIGFFLQFVSMGDKKTKEFNRLYQNALEEMNNSGVEYVRGISVVKVFNQSVYSFKNFYKSIINYKNFVLKYTLNFEVPFSLFNTMINGIFFFIIPTAIVIYNLTVDYKAFILSFIFYIVFMPAITTTLLKILYIANHASVTKESIRRIENMLNYDDLKYSKKSISPKDYGISFEDVSFKYSKNEKYALKNISFNIQQGEVIALVGPSGGGKTTIANLITRFYDPEKGSIKIGGVDVKDISKNELMDIISFVFQENRLFKESIYENVRYGKLDASKQEIMKALEKAQCNDIIEKLENGVDTVIGRDGIYLSGGEMQRIAIARALLKNAPIIILDEATAFTDPENEFKIKQSFDELLKGKTVIMIAHRLSTIKNVDKIYLVDDGEIIESGKHEELLQKEGKYLRMWNEFTNSINWKFKGGVNNA
ncbi:ABC transporter ATP-binding protein [Oceanotoga sp.]|uniref:ABC transporter ATP-binding protein n=1 Tax=Oceanotoga sp. TaxID=2108366 RepID=UPI0028054631|nr:ABC transporter ATP-binding protein [Oceanotoga sp.]